MILFGHKSVGKSRFGKLLAQELQIPFLDTDLLTEALYAKEYNTSHSCREIVLAWGEPTFRSLEAKAIANLSPTTKTIIAAGGGALLHPENCAHLRKFGPLIYLEADKESLKQRILREGIPAFLDSSNPEKAVDAMFEERTDLFERICTAKIHIHDKTDRQVLDQLHQFQQSLAKVDHEFPL